MAILEDYRQNHIPVDYEQGEYLWSIYNKKEKRWKSEIHALPYEPESAIGIIELSDEILKKKLQKDVYKRQVQNQKIGIPKERKGDSQSLLHSHGKMFYLLLTCIGKMCIRDRDSTLPACFTVIPPVPCRRAF